LIIPGLTDRIQALMERDFFFDFPLLFATRVVMGVVSLRTTWANYLIRKFSPLHCSSGLAELTITAFLEALLSFYLFLPPSDIPILSALRPRREYTANLTILSPWDESDDSEDGFHQTLLSHSEHVRLPPGKRSFLTRLTAAGLPLRGCRSN